MPARTTNEPHGRYRTHLLLIAALGLGAACHSKPALVRTPTVAIGETIAGLVDGPRTSDLANRSVHAVNVQTGQRFDTVTTAAGSFTLKVPPGSYRLEVELRGGEKLAPDESSVLLTTGEELSAGTPAANAP